jgi:hypothetical protein
VALKSHIASLGFRTSGGVRNWNFGGAQMSFWVLRVSTSGRVQNWNFFLVVLKCHFGSLGFSTPGRVQNRNFFLVVLKCHFGSLGFSTPGRVQKRNFFLVVLKCHNIGFVCVCALCATETESRAIED